VPAKSSGRDEGIRTVSTAICRSAAAGEPHDQPQAIRQDVFQDIRRRRDGSIDIDFYRADAAALRRRAIRDTFRLVMFATVRMPFKQWRRRLVLLASGR